MLHFTFNCVILHLSLSPKIFLSLYLTVVQLMVLQHPECFPFFFLLSWGFVSLCLMRRSLSEQVSSSLSQTARETEEIVVVELIELTEVLCLACNIRAHHQQRGL